MVKKGASVHPIILVIPIIIYNPYNPYNNPYNHTNPYGVWAYLTNFARCPHLPVVLAECPS
jgi:hypothetical protein